jgi:hypothetical protein
MPRSLRCLAATALCCVPAAPALAQAPYEPNDLVTQAPVLAGGRDYVAAFETGNDEDYFQFFLTERTQMDISVTHTGVATDCNYRSQHSWAVQQEDGTALFSDAVGRNETSRALQTMNMGRYVFKHSGSYCGGPSVTYQFRIEPADALVTKACYDANVGERRAIRNVTLARRAVTRARRRPALRRRYARVLAQRRATLRRNAGAVRSAC